MRNNVWPRIVVCGLFALVVMGYFFSQPAVAGPVATVQQSETMAVLVPQPSVTAPATPVGEAPLTAATLVTVLERAGFTGDSLRIAWAVVMRESNGYSHIRGAVNPDGTRDYGLFQINDVHRSHTNFRRIYDPVYNAEVAYALTGNGTDFSDWGVGDRKWAHHLRVTAPRTWQMLQDRLTDWENRFPATT